MTATLTRRQPAPVHAAPIVAALQDAIALMNQQRARHGSGCSCALCRSIREVRFGVEMASAYLEGSHTLPDEVKHFRREC